MSKEEIPNEFIKVTQDFIKDLIITFPECSLSIKKWWKEQDDFSYIDDIEERNRIYNENKEKIMDNLFHFCKKKYPPRFFDILYENVEIFKMETDIDTEFLPEIDFKNLWNCNITETTRNIIWKYLQLIMFSIVSTLDTKDAFGDTTKLFEAIDQEEFNKKLQETMRQMNGLFDMSGNMFDTSGNMPNPDDIQSHLSGIMEGKIGQLAKEIAEEATQEFNMEDVTDMKDVFDKLMKNPTKIMELVKTIGSKLDSKLKSGELKESELMAEAKDLMNKMKSMPGMGNIESLLSKMGVPNVGGAKVNTAAMEAQLNRKMKNAQLKERIRAKSDAMQKMKLVQSMKVKAQEELKNTKPVLSEEELLKILGVDENMPKTQKTSNNPKPLLKGKKSKK
jgi:hypothetical protein